jgi:hypothetical protein
MSEDKKICASYIVKSTILELRKIESTEVILVQEITQNTEKPMESNLILEVKQEFQNTLKENLSRIKPEKMELHNQLAEYSHKFLSHYEKQLFSNTS